MKNILISTDLSNCTLNTLRYAIVLGVKSKSKIYFYHANENQKPDVSEFALNFIKDIYSQLNFNFDTAAIEIIIENNPFSISNIKNITEKYNIDLVVMGSSHEGLKTTFFGSHVSDLIDHINCPVLSIPHDYSDTDIERIAYATELHDLDDRIKEIIPFAKVFDASIEAVHIYPVYPHIVDIKEYNVKNHLNQLYKENDYTKINLHFIKTNFDNEVVSGIREFVKSYKPDMLVLYHNPRGLFDKFMFDFGATKSVVKSSTIPVLALKKESASKIS